MFNCPTIKRKRTLLKPVEKYPVEVEEYNLVPVAKELIDANGEKYNGVVYEPTFVRKYNQQGSNKKHHEL